jgi:hypothetical protein
VFSAVVVAFRIARRFLRRTTASLRPAVAGRKPQPLTMALTCRRTSSRER